MRLSVKAKLFLEYCAYYNIDIAKHKTTLERTTIWRILKSEEGKQYLSEQLRKALNDLGISYKDLIEKRMDITTNKKCSLTLKNSIYKDFQVLLEDKQQDQPLQLPGNKPLAQLLPSKEIFIKPRDNKEKDTG